MSFERINLVNEGFEHQDQHARTVSCTLCGLVVTPFELCPISFGRIVQCPECNLVRVWPMRSAQELAALHADPAYFNHPYFEARRDCEGKSRHSNHQRLLYLLTNNHPETDLRLLDIGCDTGGFLAVARDEFGIDATGIEVSPTAAAAARQRYGLNVLVGDVMEMHLPGESFDIITLVDVVEHTSNPVTLLAELVRLLRPGGRLCIVTPDHDALINTIGLGLHRLFGRACRSLLEKLYIPVHEFYFTRFTLSRLVGQAGLDVIHHISQEFPLEEFGHGPLLKLGLVPIFALQRLMKRQTLQELVAIKAR